MQLKISFRTLVNRVHTAAEACAASLLILNAFAVPIYARDSVPEIDPGSAASGLALLVGGAIVVANRVRRRN